MLEALWGRSLLLENCKLRRKLEITSSNTEGWKKTNPKALLIYFFIFVQLLLMRHLVYN